MAPVTSVLEILPETLSRGWDRILRRLGYIFKEKNEAYPTHIYLCLEADHALDAALSWLYDTYYAREEMRLKAIAEEERLKREKEKAKSLTRRMYQLNPPPPPPPPPPPVIDISEKLFSAQTFIGIPEDHKCLIIVDLELCKGPLVVRMVNAKQWVGLDLRLRMEVTNDP